MGSFVRVGFGVSVSSPVIESLVGGFYVLGFYVFCVDFGEIGDALGVLMVVW